MSQSQSRHQSGSSDMQLWQQQMMYKQLQELEQRQQIQQANQIATQKNARGQLSTAAKQSSADLQPALVNGMPINNASNGVWHNEFVGGRSNMPNDSTMLSRNPNWTPSSMHGLLNGSIFSNEPGQAAQPVGFVSQQGNQSLYGMPVSINRGSLNQYARMQGLPSASGSLNQYAHMRGLSNASNNMLMKASGNQNASQSEYGAFSEQGNGQDHISPGNHGFRANGLLRNDQSQSQSNCNLPTNFNQDDQSPSHVQKAQAQQGPPPEWLGTSADKVMQAGAYGGSNLDPTEKKLLFGTDDGVSWNDSFYRNVSSVGNSMESDKYFSGFPSLQSGSFSALMLDALDGTSSDNGVQEEWSGLSVHNSEASMGNHNTGINVNTSKQNALIGKNLHNSFPMSPSSSPFYNKGEGHNSQNSSAFHHSSSKSAYEQNERIPTDTSVKQQLLKESIRMPLDQMQKHLEKSGLQEKIQMDDAVAGAWTRNNYEKTVNAACTDRRELPSLGLQSAWAPQQLQSNIIGDSNQKQHCSSTMESQMPGDNGISNIHGNTNQEWQSQTSDLNWNMHTNMHQDGSVWIGGRNSADPTFRMEPKKSDPLTPKMSRENTHMNSFAATNADIFNRNLERGRQIGNTHHGNFGKPIGGDLFVKTTVDKIVGSEQHQPSNGPVPWDQSMNDGRASNECHVSGRSNPIHLADDGSVPAENSLLMQQHAHTLDGSNTKSVDYDQNLLGFRGFQHSASGNVPMNMNPSSSYQALHAQGMTQFREPKHSDQGYIGQSQFIGHAVSDASMGKGQLSNIKRNAEGQEETRSGDSIARNDSGRSSFFNAKTGQWSEKMKMGQTSQYMLELLQKVDQPGDSKISAQLGFSGNHISEIPVATATIDSSLNQSNRSSVSHEFGLRLSPPTERQSFGNQDLSDQTYSRDANIKQLKKEVVDEKQPPIPSEVTSQRESLDHVSSISGHIPREMLHLFHGNSSTSNASSLSFIRNQLQTNTCDERHPSNLKHSHDACAGALPHQSFQASMPDVSGKILTSGNASSDNYTHFSEQSQMHDTGHSHQVNSNISQSNSEKEVALFERRPASLACTTGMNLVPQDSTPASLPSNQAGMLPLLHNVWRNAGSQRLPNVHSTEFAPNKVQSMIPSTTGKDSSLQTLHEPYDQRNNARGSPSSFGVIPINNHQQFIQRVGSYQGHEPVNKHFSDGNLVSIPSSVHQQDFNHGKHLNDSEHGFQSLHHSFKKGSFTNHDIGIHGHTTKPSNIQLQRYSLWQQMQAMKGADPDMGMVKDGDLGPDDPNMDRNTSSLFAYSQSKIFSAPSSSGQRIPTHNTFSPDKLLSFSSRENEDTSDIISKEYSSQDVHASGNEFRSATQSPINMNPSYFGTSLPPHVSPQMLSSWFEQYGRRKNGEIFSNYDVLKNFAPAMQQHLISKFGEDFGTSSMLQDWNDANCSGIIDGSAPIKNETQELVPHRRSLDKLDRSVLLKLKKRKTLTSDLPWYKELAQNPQSLSTISIAELDWAQATNRLLDKVGDDFEMIEDGPTIPRPRRRLTLTKQLMQQLIPSVPYRILSDEASLSYESMSYVVARSALGDACGMSSCSGSVHSIEAQDGIMKSDRFDTSMDGKNDACSNAVEAFKERSRKLQCDSSRLGRGTTFLDLRLECQDLERFAVVNRLGRFHGSRSQAEAASAPPRMFLYAQRYVTPFPVTEGLPEEGVRCLPL